MTVSGSGGYIMHAIKVYVKSPVLIIAIAHYRGRYDDPNANAVTMRDLRRGKSRAGSESLNGEKMDVEEDAQEVRMEEPES